MGLFDEVKYKGKCEHKRVDYAWSRGAEGRCLDCGAITGDEGWEDPVVMFQVLLDRECYEGAAVADKYLTLSIGVGIPYPNPATLLKNKDNSPPT